MFLMLGVCSLLILVDGIDVNCKKSPSNDCRFKKVKWFNQKGICVQRFTCRHGFDYRTDCELLCYVPPKKENTSMDLLQSLLELLQTIQQPKTTKRLKTAKPTRKTRKSLKPSVFNTTKSVSAITWTFFPNSSLTVIPPFISKPQLTTKSIHEINSTAEMLLPESYTLEQQRTTIGIQELNSTAKMIIPEPHLSTASMKELNSTATTTLPEPSTLEPNQKRRTRFKGIFG